MPLKVLLCFLFLVSPSLLASGEDRVSAEVFLVRGVAALKTADSDAVSLRVGDAIDTGDVVVTGENALVVFILPDGSKIKMNQNSEMSFSEIIASVGGESVGRTSLVLSIGSAVMDIENKNNEPKLEVKTKSVSMGVRGTRFYAGYDAEQNETWAAVDRGELEIYDPNQRETRAEVLEKGQAMLVQKGSFSQPTQYDWQSELDYDVSSEHQAAPRIRQMRERFRENIKAKRRAWQPDAKRMQQKRKQWAKRRENWQKRNEQFRGRLNQLRQERRQKRVQKIQRMREDRQRKRIRRKLKRDNRQQGRTGRGQAQERRQGLRQAGDQAERRFDRKSQGQEKRTIGKQPTMSGQRGQGVREKVRDSRAGKKLRKSRQGQTGRQDYRKKRRQRQQMQNQRRQKIQQSMQNKRKNRGGKVQRRKNNRQNRRVQPKQGIRRPRQQR